MSPATFVSHSWFAVYAYIFMCASVCGMVHGAARVALFRRMLGAQKSKMIVWTPVLISLSFLSRGIWFVLADKGTPFPSSNLTDTCAWTACSDELWRSEAMRRLAVEPFDRWVPMCVPLCALLPTSLTPSAPRPPPCRPAGLGYSC